ncbi:hypothetical protein NW754_013619 [Fusarium falciforme]|nr:hypothetical protein NW754_013619 [Fusarium falciforme]
MATGTPTKEGDIPTVRDKNVDSRRVPSDAGTGAHSKGLRRSLRGNSNIGNPAKANVDRLTPGAAERNEPKSTNEQRGKKDAGVDGDAAAAPASMDESQVNKFNAHRVDAKVSTVEIQVEWEGGETTWEAERDLQEDVPALVYKYWDGLGGRNTATGLDLYHVFRILQSVEVPKGAEVPKSTQPSDNSKDTQYMYRVQWVGFRHTDSTWERESKLREVAPDEFKKFEAKESERGNAESRKRKNIHGPGRPRKKARGANN